MAKREQVYLISAGRHWSLIQGDRYVCGISRQIVPLEGSWSWRKRLKQAIAIYRDREVDFAAVIAELPAVKRRLSWRAQAKLRLEVKKLAEPYGITVDDSERDHMDTEANIWVYPPERLEDKDPFDNHACEDWDEARNRVTTYIQLIEENTLETAAQPADSVTS